MTANLIRDDIDFGAYMASTEANHKLIPAGAYAEEVADYLEKGLQLTGARLPWRKTRDLIRFRPGEVTLWSGMGYYMVIYLAGLQGIPRSLYEVARLEGVSAWQQFWHITVPLLRPAMAIVAVMSSIASMKVFEEIYVMTQGGPMAASKTLVYFIYETAFVEFEMGLASAAGMALFAITLVLSLVQLRLLRKKTA